MCRRASAAPTTQRIRDNTLPTSTVKAKRLKSAPIGAPNDRDHVPSMYSHTQNDEGQRRTRLPSATACAGSSTVLRDPRATAPYRRYSSLQHKGVMRGHSGQYVHFTNRGHLIHQRQQALAQRTEYVETEQKRVRTRRQMHPDRKQSSVASKELKASATWYTTEPRAWTPTCGLRERKRPLANYVLKHGAGDTAAENKLEHRLVVKPGSTWSAQRSR